MSASKKANNSSKKMVENPTNEDDDVCVVCFRSVEIYSVGDCDHPVCYECSTRMRVLIDRTECPICRKDMSQVVFIPRKSLAPFRTLNTRNMSYERRYFIFFESDREMRAYDRLLEHPCPACPEDRIFKTFDDLKTHVSHQHQRYYCELCITFLKIFTRERRAYTRAELAQHRRKGDPDDTSHRGHPLCEFCDIRFLDSDELFRHLRKDHFYCHFCDADGLHQYYDDYPALRGHFRGSHFLCEEGDCKNEQFTSVFRDKIDLQGHFLDNHADNKRAARQARTVDIEFTVNHAPTLVHRDDRGRGGRGRGGARGRGGSRGGWDDSPAEELPPPPPPQHSIDINCVQDFPTLGNQTVEVPRVQSGRSFTLRASRGNVASMEEEFPALGSSGGPARGGAAHNSATTSVHFKVNAKKGGASDNSSRGGGGGGQRGAVSIQYSQGGDQKPLKGVSKNSSQSAANVVSSKAGNITLKLKSNKNNFGGGHKDNNSADFPSLRQPSRSLTATFSGGESFSAASAVPTQSARNTPMASNISSTKVTSSVRAKDYKSNGFQKLPNNNDFPSLGSDTKQDGGMKNYHGMSKVTVPVNNSWTKTTEYVPATTVAKPPAAPDTSAASAKGNNNSKNGNKKKKSSVAPLSASTNGTTQTQTQTKKRPLRLGNVFEASDEEEENEEPNLGITYAHSRKDYDMYNHVSKVPEASSNMKVLPSEAFEARKKSELKIGSLKTSVPKLNSSGDFPSLGGKKKVNANRAESNGDGWASVTSKKPNKSSKAESGDFSNTDMTFHSSYGESFHIAPLDEVKTGSAKAGNALKGKKEKSKNLKFIPPQDFEQRNQLLIKTISDHCGGNTDQFKQFKTLAVNLRSGSLEGRAYYQQCRQLMGKTTLLSILPELLGLLPDIGMQQAVFKAYKQTDEKSSDDLQLTECSKCGQVLRNGDLQHHLQVHDKADFPSLSSISLH